MKNKILEQSYYDDHKLFSKNYRENRKRIVKDAVKDILNIARIKIKKDQHNIKVLDVGSGRGDYSYEISKHVKKVIGVEPYTKNFLDSEKLVSKRNNLEFHNLLIEDFKTQEKFDLVLSLTTLEHMPNAHESFKNALSMMKNDGIMYLTAPNRLWPYENHYKLPFLSWLPLPLANLYVRLTGRGVSYEDSAYSRTCWGIKKLFDSLDCEYEFIVPSKDSDYIGCGEESKYYNLIKSKGIDLINKYPIFWNFSKGFIMVIKKKEKTKNPFNLNLNYHYHLIYKSLDSRYKKILDFGCGNGKFIGIIQDGNRELHGVDVDKSLIAMATKAYPNVTFKNLEIGANLPYPDNYFDAVTMNHVLEHVDSEERTIEECSRVLKQKGGLFLSSPYAGLFEWADVANLRYRYPKLHKYLYKKIWGEEEYNRKFAEDNEMYGDCSTPRKWHKHYSETEIRNILKDYFVIDEFVKYSFFLPFLFFLYNIFDILFKQKDSLFVRKLIWLDSKLRFGDYSYNFFVSAKKK